MMLRCADFQSEIEYMRSHWIDILKNGDPYYNKNLSLTKWNYSLKPHSRYEWKQKTEMRIKEKLCKKYQS